MSETGSSPSDRRGFLGVTEFRVSRACVATTYRFLRERGALGVEGVVFWPGRREGDRVDVEAAVVPAQTAYKSEAGLRYRVEEDELARFLDAVLDAGLVFPIQVHSHPGEAYHSSLDDEEPAVGTVGGLSIVVPDFAAGPPDPDLWAVYRLRSGEGWVLLDVDARHSLLRIV